MPVKGNMSNEPSGFLSDIGRDLDLIVETPNGTRHANSNHGMFQTGPSPPQEHEGALNPPSNYGNRGGSAGKKPVGA